MNTPIAAEPSDERAEIGVEIVDRSGDTVAADPRWDSLVGCSLTALGATGPGRVGVAFVDPAEIGELARLYLDGDGSPTDVLSFPVDGLSAEGSETVDSAARGWVDVPRDYGDIVLCPAVARRQAPEHSGSIHDEIAVLLVHSCCHLMGFDHAEADDREAMWAAERRLIAGGWGPLATDPWASR